MLVIFELVFIVIAAFGAIVVDLGVLRNNRQILVNALDAAALAGGSLLPVDGAVAGQATAANQLIAATIQADYPGLPTSGYTIAYNCLIGVDTGNQPYISRDVPLVCNPVHALGHTPVAADFKGAGPTRYAACNPALGDKCNVVVVTGSATTQYSLATLVGVNSGSTGTVMSAACAGSCGESPLTPVDVVLILDRTGSMSGTDTANATTAANALVSLYSPASQWLGLSLLGPSRTVGGCASAPDPKLGTANLPGDLRRWVPVGLSGTGSAASTTYAGITAALTCYTNSSTGTDLADPITAAAYELLHNGRTGIRKGIILETDGQPNTAVGAVVSSQYCLAASDAATAAKAAGITIFTIGFGLDGSNNASCPDGGGPWVGKTATSLLATMATQPSTDALGCPGTTTPNTNTDGDYFYCLPKTTGASANLAALFQVVAAKLASGAHLVDLCPAPFVTSLTPSAWTAAGTSVTIAGEYFTGATSVSFGGTPATAFSVSGDTSITAVAPSGTAGVVVTTQCGTN